MFLRRLGSSNSGLLCALAFLNSLRSGSFDNTTRLWDARTGSCLRSFERHTSQVYTQSFSHSGQYYATGAGDGKVFIYSVKVSGDFSVLLPRVSGIK